jgi:hypothetical protein
VDLRQLTALVTVAEVGRVTKAARLLAEVAGTLEGPFNLETDREAVDIRDATG